MLVRRCLMMGAGALLVAGVLLAIGVPGAILFALAPVLVCVAMHLVMGHGDPDGRQLLETAQRAVRPPEK
jgi:Protein of unknown function (DUF2933)